MKLETKRLILRKPRKGDVNDFIEGMNNLKISKWLAKVPYPYKKKDALWFINHCKKKDNYSFNIELKAEKKLIGGIGLHAYDEFNESAEIGFWVNEKYWRQGILSEASMALIDFGFKKLKLNRLVQKAYVGNRASNLVAKKFGYKLEGTERKSAKAKATGKIHDCNVYGMLKNEWPKNKKRLKRK
jgi:[ribosomal protein S5]-alanine N-acetyltransferase